MWALAGVAAFEAVNGFQQAETIRGNARLSKQINDMNADAELVDAYNAEKQGYTEAARYETNIDQTIGAARVAYNSADVDSDYGTAAEKIAENKVTGMLNIQDILQQAHNKALGFENQARNTRLQGVLNQGLANQQSSAVIASGLLSGAKTFASGYGQNVTKTNVKRGDGISSAGEGSTSFWDKA